MDSPVGNMDMSAPPLGEASTPVAVNSHLYPFGVSEQYPNMATSGGDVLPNTGHAYAECSNRGFCNRGTGECECLNGFEGANCARAACPGFNGAICSGHGVCYSARKFAFLDSGNVYELWDKHMTQGCHCDRGYYGSDCSLRQCPVGFDPVYAASLSRGSRRYSAWTYTLHVPTATASITGVYAIEFHDVFGEDWRTDPLPHDADCDAVVAALEGFPNSVVPGGSVRCVKSAWGQLEDLSPIQLPSSARYYGQKYSLAFSMNPGLLKQISINMFLDDSRPTLYSTERSSRIDSFVYPESGMYGETTDHFNDRCFGVLFKLARQSQSTGSREDWLHNGEWTVLHDLNIVETARLKRCLHLSGGGVNNTLYTEYFQGEEFQWEGGSRSRPHVVRVVPLYGVPNASDLARLFAGPRRVVDDETSGGAEPDDSSQYLYDYPGFLAALVYDKENEQFKLFNRYDAATMGGGSDDVEYAIQTTEGELVLSTDNARIITSSERKLRVTDASGTTGLYDRYAYAVAVNASISPFYDFPFVDCETFFADNAHAFTKAEQVHLRLDVSCIEKGDALLFFDTRSDRVNPAQLPLYRVDKISRLKRDKFTNIVEMELNMGFTSYWPEEGPSEGRAYLFRPPSGEGSYQYVAECSGRGHCDTDTGVCDCFTGYGGSSCADQSHIMS